MTDKEALKMALEFIERVNKEGWILDDFEPQMYQAITALKERLEDPMREVQRLGQEIEQEPICPECKAEVLYECVACSSNNYPPQRTEQNFCSRCGKRTPDAITIHTCTPPKENT
jgi:hypothetical protein